MLSKHDDILQMESHFKKNIENVSLLGKVFVNNEMDEPNFGMSPSNSVSNENGVFLESPHFIGTSTDSSSIHIPSLPVAMPPTATIVSNPMAAIQILHTSTATAATSMRTESRGQPGPSLRDQEKEQNYRLKINMRDDLQKGMFYFLFCILNQSLCVSFLYTLFMLYKFNCCRNFCAESVGFIRWQHFTFYESNK